MNDGPEAPSGVVEDLRQTLEQVLDRHVPTGGPVALLDVPAHTNVGDHAITLGELTYFRQRGNEVRYVCSLHDFSPSRLRERRGDGAILIHGGGNLGDLWPHHQLFREQVLADFPAARVVQLPQSIKFESDESLERARRAFGSHEDFTLLVRDREALAFAQQHFDCPTELCPDSAVALGPQSRRAEPDTDVLVLARTDHETSAPLHLGPDPAIEVLDWIEQTTLRCRALKRFAVEVGAKSRKTQGSYALLSPLVRRAYEALARDRVEFGLALLSRGRVVITDRLHGHILCVLLGIPHVIHDAGYGKIAGFHAAWTSGSSIVRVSDTQQGALEAALELLSEMQRPDRAAD
jgi:exopolysaccharide biosynthesis protein PssK